jgi:hypothetical protein
VFVCCFVHILLQAPVSKILAIDLNPAGMIRGKHLACSRSARRPAQPELKGKLPLKSMV